MPLAPGAIVPDAPLVDLAGGRVLLSGALAGGPALIFVYNQECPTTAVAAPALPRFARIPGLRLVAVSQNGGDETRGFAAMSGWAGRVQVLVDPEPWAASDGLGVRATPMWLLCADGRAVSVLEGWSRDDVNALAATAAAMVGAPPPVIAAPDGPEPAFRPG